MRVLILLLLAVHAPCVACDDLPAQQAPHDSFNVAKKIGDALISQLRQAPFPPVVAAIALIFGAILLFNGLTSFKYSVTAACAITIGILAQGEASHHFQGHETGTSNIMSNVVGIEAFLLAGAIAHIGHKGIMVILGAAAGFWVAHFLSEFLVINFQAHILTQVEVEVVFYSICSLVGSYWMYNDKHEKLLVILSPIPGGIFTASALLYFATEAFVAFGCHHDNVKQMWQSENAKCPNNLTPKVAPWIDFFLLGFSHMHSANGKEDVGIFYNTTFNMNKGGWSAGNQQAQGFAVLYDHILTIVLWVLLTLTGIWIQRRVIRRRKGQIEAAKKAEQRKRETAEMQDPRRKQAAQEATKRQQAETKPENGSKPAQGGDAKSKWPFGGKKENKASQLEEGLIDKGKGA